MMNAFVFIHIECQGSSYLILMNRCQSVRYAELPDQISDGGPHYRRSSLYKGGPHGGSRLCDVSKSGK